MALGMNVTLRNAMLDEITAAAGGSAILRLYDGTQPATGGTATNQMAQLTMNNTFAAAAAGGVLTINSISSDTSADGGGTATWFRITTSVANGSLHVLDGTVSTVAAGTGDLQLDDTVIVGGGTVAISSATITAGNA